MTPRNPQQKEERQTQYQHLGIYINKYILIHQGGVKMIKDVNCEIRCLSCNGWFRSPIQFGDAKSFFESATHDNISKCPHCGKMTSYKKDNMRFQDINRKGRVIYKEGQYTY